MSIFSDSDSDRDITTATELWATGSGDILWVSFDECQYIEPSPAVKPMDRQAKRERQAQWQETQRRHHR